MKLLGLAVILVLCALSQALTLSAVATVSLALFTLNKPVSSDFGAFRRRNSPFEETVLEPESPFTIYNQPMTSRFNPYMFGAGGYLLPAFGAPAFGMFGVNRFPPRIDPTRPIRTSHPKREVPSWDESEDGSEMSPVTSSQFILVPEQLTEVPSDVAYEYPRDDFAGMSAEDLEAYFELVAEYDEKRCVARSVCEMGANPESGGQFVKLVVDMMGSLNDFPDGSKVAEYHEALILGMVHGSSACKSTFQMCDEESYQHVRTSQGLSQVYAVPRAQYYSESTL